jgi:hypothetical protein
MALSDSAFEAFADFESESESAEARAPVRRPSSQSSFRPRPAPNAPAYVTQTQLEAALARSDGKIKVVADGVSTINARVASLGSAYKKEADERKKSVDSQSKDLNQKLQMLALLPMLVQAPSYSTPGVKIGATVHPLQDASGNPITTVSGPDNSTMDMLLPLLMVTGMGGTGGLSLGGGDSGSDGSSMMMLALVLAMANK